MIRKRMLNLFYMIQPLMSDVCTKFQNPRCSSFLENFAKTFIRVKEKWINTGNDKHKDADSVLHDTSSGTRSLYQISKSSVQ